MNGCCGFDGGLFAHLAKEKPIELFRFLIGEAESCPGRFDAFDYHLLRTDTSSELEGFLGSVVDIPDLVPREVFLGVDFGDASFCDVFWHNEQC